MKGMDDAMLTEICAEIKNYFCTIDDILIGDYSIENGAIVPSIDFSENQYFRIVGSIFNDGVHKNGDALIDEATFHGSVWKMRVPQDIITLADEIADWQVKNADVIASPYVSESFGGYTYTKASGYGNQNSMGTDWRSQASFAARLKPYRRIRVI